MTTKPRKTPTPPQMARVQEAMAVQGQHAMLGGGPQLPGVSSDAQKKIVEFITGLMEGMNRHKPVLNSLKEMKVVTKIQDIGGEPCLVIPIQELMMKEYLHMSGVDMAQLSGGGDGEE